MPVCIHIHLAVEHLRNVDGPAALVLAAKQPVDVGHAAHVAQSDYIGALSYLAKRNKRRSLIILFTDAENYDQANEIAQALEPLRRRHLIFVVRVSDPHIKELAVAKVGSDQQLYDRAAATWYKVDRRRAEMRLFTKGVESIDAEPQDLSAALVGAYLRVKERNLL